MSSAKSTTRNGPTARCREKLRPNVIRIHCALTGAAFVLSNIRMALRFVWSARAARYAGIKRTYLCAGPWRTDRPGVGRRRKMAGLVQLLRTGSLRCGQAAHPRQTIQASNFQILTASYAEKGSNRNGGAAPKRLGFSAFAPRYMPLTGFRKGAYCDAPRPDLGLRVGAQVASLRCPTLRPAHLSISDEHHSL